MQTSDVIDRHQDPSINALKPDVTVIMLPRERFSFTHRSIESLYSDQSIPFNFICIDGGSPRKVRDFLRSESQRRHFKLIHKPYYLTPNEARNLAFEGVQTRYAVFVDNDIIFAPMWLEQLVRCADETNAAIVAPLTCIGEPIHTTVHMAGGDVFITLEGEKRILRETHLFPDRPVAEVHDQLIRKPTNLAEFHCMLVRTEWLKQLGGFDEGLKATSEHTDFCLTTRQRGGSIMIEPRAVVTQLFGLPLHWSDLKFFFFRWNSESVISSEQYLRKKWGAAYDDSILHEFIVPRRRGALPRLHKVLHGLVGWRITGWLFNRIAGGFAWWAKRGRAAVNA